MATSEFDWHQSKYKTILPGIKGSKLKLSDEILISNIRWFIIFRWGVIGALVILKALAIFVPDTLMQFGVMEHQNWPIVIILVLSLANIFYIYALDYWKASKFNSPTINLWAQIVIDLICLSVVVHYVGSTATPASFFLCVTYCFSLYFLFNNRKFSCDDTGMYHVHGYFIT